MFGGTDTWVTYANLDASYKQNIPETSTITITGNTFTSGTGSNAVTFTKQQ
jgi:hypothetical protein